MCIRFSVFLAALLFLAGSGESAFAEKRRVLFLGSSTIAGWTTLSKAFPGLKVVNLGKGGTDYPYLAAHAADWADKYPSDDIVIYSGDNDIAGGASAETIVSGFETTVKLLHAKQPAARINVISIKPCPEPRRRAKLGEVRKANLALAKAAAALGYVKFVDTFSAMIDADGEPRRELFVGDGVHLNSSGYALWAKILAPFLANR